MASIKNNKKNKKKLIVNSVAIDLGCGSCKTPIANLFNLNRKQKSNKHNSTAATFASSGATPTSSKYDTASATSFSAANTPLYCSSSDDDDSQFCFMIGSSGSSIVRGFGRVGGASVAVEKESDDPYLDFRHSMLQMILEKEIYAKEELKELLNVFLKLNSPYYHGVIVRAFTDIWNGVFSVHNNINAAFVYR